jgi:hypothetical protein
MTIDNEKRLKLLEKLREKLSHNKTDRHKKVVKNEILESSFKEMGIDKTRFDEDLKAVKKSGGDVSMSLNDMMAAHAKS